MQPVPRQGSAPRPGRRSDNRRNVPQPLVGLDLRGTSEPLSLPGRLRWRKYTSRHGHVGMLPRQEADRLLAICDNVQVRSDSPVRQPLPGQINIPPGLSSTSKISMVSPALFLSS